MTTISNNSEQTTIVDLAYDNLLIDIAHWQSMIQNNTAIYDLAFFKIFVKFEGYLITVFKEYICGKSSTGYTPECKLMFDNLSHFERLIKSNSKGTFIDYLNIIENFSKEVFNQNKNPFDCVFADGDLKPLYLKMRYIRNHIAHESSESKHTYHKKVLSNLVFEEPNQHLQKRVPQKSITYFNEYVEAIEKSALILKNPTPFL